VELLLLLLLFLAARIRYSSPVSLMSTDGAQSNFDSVSAANLGHRPKTLGKRLNISSIALKGSQRTRLMAFSRQTTWLEA